MVGWIKLYRKLIDWEWYDDSHMVHLFIHLLISANIETKTWKGIEVHRGQLVFGRRSVSEKTKISEQSIRTCMKRLLSTNEITIQSTNRYSIVTVCNFDDYQPSQKKSTSQSTNEDDEINHTLRIEEKRKIIIDHLNQVVDKNFRANSKNTIKFIDARLNEGYHWSDFKYVIENKSAQWKGTDMDKYLRPETLFSNRFESYLNEKPHAKQGGFVS